MHDPMTVAHEIYLGKKQKKNGHYRNPFITIWHVDPEKDGTDDSCGWFIRIRHIDKVLVDKVRKEFRFNFDHNYWFNEAGYPKFSTSGTVLQMYQCAVWQLFMWQNNNKPTNCARKQMDKFFRKHLHEILLFAENPVDSLYNSIHSVCGDEKKDARIENFVSIVLADVIRKIRPWYQHPKWHIHHWKIQFHPWQRFKRRYLDKCCKCGRRGFKSAPFSDWNGTKRWHQGCDDSRVNPKP